MQREAADEKENATRRDDKRARRQSGDLSSLRTPPNRFAPGGIAASRSPRTSLMAGRNSRRRLKGSFDPSEEPPSSFCVARPSTSRIGLGSGHNGHSIVNVSRSFVYEPTPAFLASRDPPPGCPAAPLRAPPSAFLCVRRCAYTRSLASYCLFSAEGRNGTAAAKREKGRTEGEETSRPFDDYDYTLGEIGSLFLPLLPLLRILGSFSVERALFGTRLVPRNKPASCSGGLSALLIVSKGGGGFGSHRNGLDVPSSNTAICPCESKNAPTQDSSVYSARGRRREILVRRART
ncbi:hypothetical protein HPB51_024271 [Rhipicephalus microplus]|uniref:Uncharacterized protein n=1 Tax=Rhipicephalus microplus TaxID=6941 RepID=A0A9J6EK81_RHIMP|nr:hypothetical protein HPB51_024271 [Rhipicephalus microplus]